MCGIESCGVLEDLGIAGISFQRQRRDATAWAGGSGGNRKPRYLISRLQRFDPISAHPGALPQAITFRAFGAAEISA
jgi:hypothetical protein